MRAGRNPIDTDNAESQIFKRSFACLELPTFPKNAINPCLTSINSRNGLFHFFDYPSSPPIELARFAKNRFVRERRRKKEKRKLATNRIIIKTTRVEKICNSRTNNNPLRCSNRYWGCARWVKIPKKRAGKKEEREKKRRKRNRHIIFYWNEGFKIQISSVIEDSRDSDLKTARHQAKERPHSPYLGPCQIFTPTLTRLTS